MNIKKGPQPVMAVVPFLYQSELQLVSLISQLP